MKRKHVVRQGECIASLAARYGVPARAIWDDAANHAVQTARRNPHVLLPGDVLTIPTPDDPGPSVAGGQANRYRASIPTLALRLTVHGADGPRAGEPFKLEIAGRPPFEGTTDGDGIAELHVRADDVAGVLVVGSGSTESRVRLDFGHLNPAADVTGAQQRLHNLGFLHAPADGTAGPETAAALRAFQTHHGLDVTGQLDEPTQRALEDHHGS